MKKKKMGLAVITIGVVYTFLYFINAFNSYAYIYIPPNETNTLSKIGLYVMFAGVLIYVKDKSEKR